MSGAREAALAFMAQTRATVADRVERHPLGTLVVTPSLDRVWSLNALHLAADPAGLALDALDAALTETYGPDRWASVVVERSPAADALEAQARERRWQVEHEVVMDLRREPDRIADTASVREGTRDEMLALSDRWFEEDFSKQGRETLEQLLKYARREWDARPTRAFVAGDAQAMCKLWSDGATAQVEDVFTAPEARGHGYARALVTRALLEAREGEHELIFIVADDDDTPQELYGRLGFDRLVATTRLIRAPGADGGG